MPSILSLIFPRDDDCLRGNETRDERDGYISAMCAVLDYRTHKYSWDTGLGVNLKGERARGRRRERQTETRGRMGTAVRRNGARHENDRARREVTGEGERERVRLRTGGQY